MLVVIPFYTADVDRAVRNLEWGIELDGKIKHDCILSYPRGTDASKVKTLAERYFSSVLPDCVYDDWKGPRDWPQPHNWAWQKLVRHIEQNVKRPFFWWETDAVLMRRGAIDAITDEYEKCGKPFMGFVWPQTGQMNGSACYPAHVSYHSVNSLICRQAPWDVVLSKDCPRAIHPANHLLHHEWKLIPIRTRSAVFRILNRGTVLFHRFKDGNMLKLLRSAELAHLVRPGTVVERNGEEYDIDKEVEQHKHFYHSGDLGDVIYSLPVVRHLGGGILHLGPYTKWPTREKMTQERANVILPLLKAQDYIIDADFSDTLDKTWTDLNEFRTLFDEVPAGSYFHHTLVEVPCEWFGVPFSVQDTRWLSVVPKRPPRPVIISRSSRYHNPKFDWKGILAKYGNAACFVGTRDEYLAFIHSFGNVQYLPTSDLLELARYIRGSELFIGNQSCPYSIAEALKHPSILEWIPGQSQNCHFSRPALSYGTFRKTLPAVGARKKLNWHVLTDNHSGLGRIAWEFAVRVRDFDLHWVPTRMSEDMVPLPDKSIIQSRLLPGPSFVLEGAEFLTKYVQKGDVVYSMWESSRLPRDAVITLNKAKAVIVPSEWCRACYIESGVRVPISKVPLGISTDVYHEVPEKRDPTVFKIGASCRLVPTQNPRKNLTTIIEGFLKAFVHERDVVLCIKGYDKTIPSPDPRVEIISEFWTQRQMAEWYSSLDMFVNLASGGGWELHLQEAMACGAVPVSINYSSSLEFVNSHVGYLVDYRLADATWGPYKNCGKWGIPSVDHYAEILRRAYDHRAEVESKRRKAMLAASRFTLDGAGAELNRTLLEIL